MVQNTVSLTFASTNTLLISDGKTHLIIDPHFTRPGFVGQNNLLGRISPSPERIAYGLACLGVKSLDAVLLTHTHYDHALDAAEVARMTGACLVGSPSAEKIAIGAGLPKTNCQIAVERVPMKFGAFEVIFLRGAHISIPPLLPVIGMAREIKRPLTPPQFASAYREGGTYAILLQYPPSITILCMGSAGYFPNWLSGIQAQTVILPVGGLDFRGKAYRQMLFEQSVLAVDARRLFFSHWDDFTRPLDAPPRMMPACRKALIQLETLAAKAQISTARLKPWLSISL
ncbi:MAG: MBL fold metallo-hydrolase [Anaerolineae bacterium]|nr:MBL fold metallo-hydrolase [Anaerolineae bacterium]